MHKGQHTFSTFIHISTYLRFVNFSFFLSSYFAAGADSSVPRRLCLHQCLGSGGWNRWSTRHSIGGIVIIIYIYYIFWLIEKKLFFKKTKSSFCFLKKYFHISSLWLGLCSLSLMRCKNQRDKRVCVLLYSNLTIFSFTVCLFFDVHHYEI